MLKYSTAKKLLLISTIIFVVYIAAVGLLKVHHPELFDRFAFLIYLLRIPLVFFPFLIFYLLVLVVFTNVRLSSDLSIIHDPVFDDNVKKNPVFSVFWPIDYDDLLNERRGRKL